jgi:hypothetical protein
MRKLVCHVRHAYGLKSKEYFDKYIKKPADGKCVVCGNPTKWNNITDGYRETCSHVCGCTYHRHLLKNNPAKYAKFLEKMSINKTKKVEEWKESGEWENIKKKISETLQEVMDSTSPEERKEKYGWLNKLSIEEKKDFIQNIMLETGSHSWWREATEAEKEAVYEKRRLSNIKNNNLIDRNNIDLFEKYELYRAEVYKLTAETYRKHKKEINPQNLKRGRDGSTYQLDHKFSVSRGFMENIPPEILSHKFNLQILKSAENNSKNFNCSITKEELFEGVSNEKKI